VEALRLRDPPEKIAAGSEGRFLAYALGGEGASWVGIWDRRDRVETLFQPTSGRVRCLAVSSCGETLATGLADGQVEVFRSGVSGAYRRFRARSTSASALRVLRFSPGGEVLVGARELASIPVEAWEVETGRMVFRGKSPFPLRSLRFLPLGGRTWDSTGNPLLSLKRTDALAEGLSSRGDAWFAQGDWTGGYLLWGSSWPLVLEDPARGWIGYLDRGQVRWLGGPRLRLKSRLNLGGGQSRGALRVILGSGEGLGKLISSDGRSLRRWERNEGSGEVLLPHVPDRLLAGLGLAEAGQTLVFGCWSSRRGAPLQAGGGRIQRLRLGAGALGDQGREIRGCGPETVFSEDGTRVAFFGGGVGSRAPGATLVVRHLFEQQRDWILDPGDSRPVRTVALSPQGQWVATATYRARTGSNSVAVFDLAAGKLRHLHGTAGEYPTLLRFSRDEGVLAVALKEPEQGRERVVLLRLRGGGPEVCLTLSQRPDALAFHPDGRHLLVSGAERRLEVFDLRLGRSLGSVELPVSRSACLHFDPTGDHLYTGGEDGSILCWDSRTLLDRLDPGGIA
jgi:WD40 repeat protein